MREKILSIFENFKIISGGEGIKYESFFGATSKVLPGVEKKEIIEEVHSMENDGLVKDGDISIFLTDKGEEAIYGVFDINKGINEIIYIFKNFGSPIKDGIPFKTFEHIKKDKLSALTKKHCEEIMKECIDKGYIEEIPNGYMLKQQF